MKKIIINIYNNKFYNKTVISKPTMTNINNKTLNMSGLNLDSENIKTIIINFILLNIKMRKKTVIKRNPKRSRKRNIKRSRKRSRKRSMCIDGTTPIKSKCTFPGCNEIFPTNDSFETHIKNHPGYKPFTCKFPDCHFETTKKDSLTKHSKLHYNSGTVKVVKPIVRSGEKTFRCEFPGCTDSFYTKKELETHRLTHPDYKPFVCPICKKYRTHVESLLSNHIRDHTGENKFTCKFPGCDFYTKRTSNLKDHMNRRHKIVLEIKNPKKIRKIAELHEPSQVNTAEIVDFPLNMGDLPIDNIPYSNIFEPKA